MIAVPPSLLLVNEPRRLRTQTDRMDELFALDEAALLAAAQGGFRTEVSASVEPSRTESLRACARAQPLRCVCRDARRYTAPTLAALVWTGAVYAVSPTGQRLVRRPRRVLGLTTRFRPRRHLACCFCLAARSFCGLPNDSRYHQCALIRQEHVDKCECCASDTRASRRVPLSVVWPTGFRFGFWPFRCLNRRRQRQRWQTPAALLEVSCAQYRQ